MSSTQLTQITDWLRRALYEVFGWSMSKIDVNATMEKLPNGKILFTVTAVYDHELNQQQKD